MKDIFEQNRKWVSQMRQQDAQYFERLAEGQKPRYLFIGCSDSRVPASNITGTGPGEMFVHRNIANLVVNSDMNLLSVLQYAVEVLGVQDIMVVGHYGCGGVAAAASNKQYGLIDNWLTYIRDVVRTHETELLRIHDSDERLRRLVELNVIEQVRNLAKTNIVQNALTNGGELRLHGLVYDLREGLLKDLKVETDILREHHHIYNINETPPADSAPAASAAQPEQESSAKPAEAKNKKKEETMRHAS